MVNPIRLPLLLARSVESHRFQHTATRTAKASSLAARRQLYTMATPTRIQISPEETGLLGLKQTPDAAAKITELLQEDLEVR